jgi:enolase
MKISKIRAFEVLDSRGLPTIAAEVKLESGVCGRAIVPSGASLGKNEALELRDGDQKRWLGRGVLRAVKNVNEIIAPALKGQVAEVRKIDEIMLDLDGTANKSRLGANAILAVSLASVRAVASEQKQPLYEVIARLAGIERLSLPTPMVNILSGGLHAGWNVDMQDFLAIPLGASSFRQAMDYVGRVYHCMRSILQEKGFTTLLADEGGFAPNVANHEEMLKLLCKAIEKAGLKAGVQEDVAIGIDVASSHFWRDQKYFLKKENLVLDGNGIIELLKDWSTLYPIISIEDGCAEDDWSSWKEMTRKLGQNMQLVGDDIFTTNSSLIRKGIENRIANSVLIKLNQIGTMTETLDAIELCRKGGYAPVISARSGDTEDSSIADLAVGTASGQIKVGSIARSERTAKYNRLLEIEEWSETRFPFTGRECFPFVS